MKSIFKRLSLIAIGALDNGLYRFGRVGVRKGYARRGGLLSKIS